MKIKNIDGLSADDLQQEVKRAEGLSILHLRYLL